METEKSIGSPVESRKTVQEIFSKALEDAEVDISSEQLVEEAGEDLESDVSRQEMFQACYEASKSYIDEDPGMREVAADIFLQKFEEEKEEQVFQLAGSLRSSRGGF